MAQVLIVEDEPLIAKAIHDALTHASHQVAVAHDSEQAFQSLKEQQFDIVLLDLILPGNDGFSILKKIKQPNSTHFHTPVIIYSNLGEMENLNKGIDLGATDYIIKANADIPKVLKIIDKYTKYK